ncbi:MAG: response regulator, partial [Desulfobacterales bacterium]|nr:response regulator [Desulfobacterales bacterium]
SRSEDHKSGEKITRAGADKVYSLFATAGKQVAIDIVKTTGGRINGDAPVESEAAPRWIDIDKESDLNNLGIAQVRKEKGLDVIGFRRGDKDYIFPDPDILLRPSDRLLVIGDKRAGDSYMERISKYKKLVIVDDNPVIVRVFSRLFRKEGFFPITAEDGHDGLNRIIEEKPVAAVIDFMLPVISGVELCREVKEIEACRGIKLILFTADSSPETRTRALEAGADAVVVKSSDASEIIKAVIKILEDGTKQEEAAREREASRAVEAPPAIPAPETVVRRRAESPAPDPGRIAGAVDVDAALTSLMDDESLLKEVFDDFIDMYPPNLEDIG